ncbi:MAG: chloride channel protein [Bifidobacteriaceae bacterium]|jgi:H+/Cl- antiporter ClcA|nr:chloride channel protein [Bifidobacteriaceae bacterium]MCI1914894.1 chloride channel protein [Bifidobacteriaceae bacterium]
MRRFGGLAVSTVVLGVLVGCSSGLLGLLLMVTERYFLGFEESSALPAPSDTVAWRRLVSVSIGGVIVALMWWRIRRKGRISTVSAAVAGEQLPWWRTIFHVFAQIFFVGTGASLGREVAPREMGSLLAQRWMRYEKLLGLKDDDAPLLVAAAAGAGFAGVYISPLTGMFFSVEMLLRRVDRETVSVSLAMSAIATVVGSLVKGTHPYYAVGGEAMTLWFVLFCVVSAPLFAVVGSGFRRLTKWAEKRQTVGVNIVWQLPLVALVTGVVSMWIPQVMGNGRAAAQEAMNAGGLSMIPFLLVMCVAKVVLTIATIRAGASGGTLTPAIAIGAAIGAVLGIVVIAVIPGSAAVITVWQCAMVGAVATLSASQQAPLMALAMLVEITHLPIASVVPLGLAAAVSVSVSGLLKHRETSK